MIALIVDDATPTRTEFAKALKHTGYQVMQAATADEALALVESRGAVDLALVNWDLPCADGLRFAVGVRALRGSEATCVVMLTQLRQVGEILEAIHAGVDDCLIPPLTPERLLRKLAELRPPTPQGRFIAHRQGARLTR